MQARNIFLLMAISTFHRKYAFALRPTFHSHGMQCAFFTLQDGWEKVVSNILKKKALTLIYALILQILRLK